MEDVNELESIRGVGHITADKLREAGYDSFEKLTAASPEELKERIGLNPTSAANIIRAAGEVLEEAAPEVTEEPEASQEEAALEELVSKEPEEVLAEEPEETSAEEPVEVLAEEPVEVSAEELEVPTLSDPMEDIVAQMAKETATYALTEIAEQVAAAVRDLPDLGERFLEEVMRNSDLKTVVVSKTAERLADAMAD